MKTLMLTLILALALIACAPAELPTEIHANDDPVEQHFERREILVERQSREFEELDARREELLNITEECDPWYDGYATTTEPTPECQEAMDELDGWFDRSDAQDERHDEELDALDRELEALDGEMIK